MHDLTSLLQYDWITLFPLFGLDFSTGALSYLVRHSVFCALISLLLCFWLFDWYNITCYWDLHLGDPLVGFSLLSDSCPFSLLVHVNILVEIKCLGRIPTCPPKLRVVILILLILHQDRTCLARVGSSCWASICLCWVSLVWVVALLYAQQLLVFLVKWNLCQLVLSYLLLLLLQGCLIHETLATDWYVTFSTTNQLNPTIGDRAEGETRLVKTNLTNGMQLLDFLCLRYQVKNRVETFTLISCPQGRCDHNFAQLRCILAEIHYLYKARQKAFSWAHLRNLLSYSEFSKIFCWPSDCSLTFPQFWGIDWWITWSFFIIWLHKSNLEEITFLLYRSVSQSDQNLILIVFSLLAL